MKRRSTSPEKITESTIQSYRIENSDYGRTHFPYTKEDEYLDAVKNGDEQAAFTVMREVLGAQLSDEPLDESAYFEQSSNRTGVMSRNERKQIEYTAVLLIALTTRAAIQGGVDAQRAYDISDLYLQKVSESQRPEVYLQILKDAIRSFLAEVQQAQSKELRSIHVLHARNYIASNLSKNLSLDAIAKAVGLSATYLSAIFKQTEGIGVKQYVVRQRIDAAKHLLAHSDVTIGSVAASVGFGSQSHFGKVFKDMTGMTPRQFRESRQR